MSAMPVLGEPLAVELANTVVMGDDGQPHDLLQSEGELEYWLSAHAEDLPEGATEAPPSVAQARRLRTAVRQLLSAALDRQSPDEHALELVNATSRAAPLRPILVWPSDAAPRRVEATPAHRIARATLAAVARSAIELLGGPHTAQLRRCQRPGCVLLFVASNPRRRWCSPAVCGNRVRAARHYQRHRRSDESPPQL